MLYVCALVISIVCNKFCLAWNFFIRLLIFMHWNRYGLEQCATFYHSTVCDGFNNCWLNLNIFFFRFFFILFVGNSSNKNKKKLRLEVVIFDGNILHFRQIVNNTASCDHIGNVTFKNDQILFSGTQRTTMWGTLREKYMSLHCICHKL